MPRQKTPPWRGSSPAVPRQMCDGADWDWSEGAPVGHHYHFHVRLNCPADRPTRVDSAAARRCKEAEEWVADLNPPPLTMPSLRN